MIEVSHLGKSFGNTRALNDLSFSLAEGESVALWGHNGAGKSTLLHALLGLFPYEGKITLNGVDVKRDGTEARRHVGFVPQVLGFHPGATAVEAYSFFSSLRGLKVNQSSFHSMGLEGEERKRLRDLSGGMRRRLALGIALLDNPPLLLLDEPTSDLDAKGRESFLERLEVAKETGHTLLFSSHRPDEIVRLADRVLFLDGGELVQDGLTSHLFHDGSPGTSVRKTNGDSFIPVSKLGGIHA
ncbi:ABC transporter ATP-binding protein [bacterium]|nr:ABC transporter ATP-binding protein [bacterium]